MMGATHFILADNQEITAFAIETLIRRMGDNINIAFAVDKSALMNALTFVPNSVIVIDYSIFDFKGTEDFKIVRKRFPDARWILFSDEFAEKFVRASAGDSSLSFLLKDCSLSEAMKALGVVLSGGRYIAASIDELIHLEHRADEIVESLTSAEKEILKLIAQGKSVKEIAIERFSSPHTITSHKKNIFRKLGVNTVYEATKYALRAGLAEESDYYI